MNMLSQIKKIQIIHTRIQFELNQDMTIQEFYNIFHISKTRKKFFQIRPTDQFLKKDTLYTIQSYIERSQTQCFNEVDIVYEDDICLIVNKPCNLLIHDDGNTQDTLTSRVNAYLVDSPFDALPIHRIDKDTTGLVFYCKHPFFQSFFDNQIENHIIQKEYLAIVQGNFPKKTMHINQPIARDRHNAKKMMVHKNGKEAISDITKIKTINNQSLLKIKIKTGRKHQIRVHLSSIQYPIINDELYGNIIDDRKLLLQSYSLTFYSPLTKEMIQVKAYIDPRFYPFK